MANYKELCAKVLAYNEGLGKYNFSHLNPYDRENAAFDAWQEIRAELRTALAQDGAKTMPVTTEQAKVLSDIFAETDRIDKVSLQLDTATRAIKVEYSDLDDEWFNELSNFTCEKN